MVRAEFMSTSLPPLVQLICPDETAASPLFFVLFLSFLFLNVKANQNTKSNHKPKKG